jgi:hypothetical protein
MADSQTTVLRLVFGTATPGKTYAMEFNSPKAELTDALIRPVMQQFIDSQLISGKNGALTSIESAGVVTRQVTEVIS